MNVLKGATEVNVAQNFLRSKILLLAMSPTDVVLDRFYADFAVAEEAPSNVSIGLRMQDVFAHLVESCWTDIGPSDRYMKLLITHFLRHSEKKGCEIESDSLANLVARTSLINTNSPPDALESCYVSFFLDQPQNDNKCIPLKIRVFPHNNDIALRLWEAGTFLAEFFIANPGIITGKSVFELGSGCGATGLAIAAFCKPSKLHLTDYTDAWQLNLEHNLVVNQEWLSRHNFSPDRISYGYLEWGMFVKQKQSKSKNVVEGYMDCEIDTRVSPDTFEAFRQADILIAADVIYDINTIEDLLNVIECFLIESPTVKQAIIASTKRNEATFEFFLATIQKCGMTFTWNTNDEECDAFRKIFAGNYLHERSDVQICLVQMPSVEES